MNVFFNDITYMGIPLVWEYNEKTNHAVCLFTTTAKGQKYNKEIILKELGEKKYPGIILSDDSAIIEDYSSFIAKHSVERYKPVAVPLLDMVSVRKVERKLTSPAKKARSARSLGEDKPGSNREQHGDSAGVVHHVINPLQALLPRDKSLVDSTTEATPKLTKKAAFHRTHSTTSLPRNSALSARDVSSPSGKKRHSPRFNFQYKTASTSAYESILLGHLITEEEHTGIYRDTLACKKLFLEKTAQDRAGRTATYLRSIDSFRREEQYNQNDRLYTVKKEIITLLETLFKDELNPAYQEWKKQEEEKQEDKKLSPMVLEELFSYLRQAVQRAMLNSPFGNSEPTQYELLSEVERLKRFDTKEQYQYANYKIREGRTSVMLLNLFFLSDAACPITLVPIKGMSKAAVDTLQSFKAYLIQDAERVTRICKAYYQVQPLLIKSGEVEYANKQSLHALMDQLADKDNCVRGYTSLLGTVKARLIAANKTLKKQVDTAVCHQWADKVVVEVVRLLVDDQEFRKTPHVGEQWVAKTPDVGDKGVIKISEVGEQGVAITPDVSDKGVIKISEVGDQEAEKTPDVGVKEVTIIPRIERLKRADRQMTPDADEDIYLSEEWIAPCKKYLAPIEWDKILKHIKDSKRTTADMTKIATKLYEIIRMQGIEFRLESQSRASSSYATSSDNIGLSAEGVRMNF